MKTSLGGYLAGVLQSPKVKMLAIIAAEVDEVLY